MSTTVNPPPGVDRPLGEPFDRRAELLEAYAAAKRAEQAVQVDGDLDAVWRAGWAVADALGDLDSHRHHQAYTLLMMLRDALHSCPDSLSEVLSEVSAVREIADAVVALEAREGVLS